MKHWCTLLLVLMLIFAVPVFAADPPVFQNEAEETRFRELAAELRCVMCQNQSLADSNAPIANDLRNEVLTLIREGKNDDEIKQHLVERYSEFVLYEPRWNMRNALLWLGPFLILVIGGFMIVRVVRKQKTSTPTSDSNQEQEW
jgi:cytochrome c-type biogenesis protein CcmH